MFHLHSKFSIMFRISHSFCLKSGVGESQEDSNVGNAEALLLPKENCFIVAHLTSIKH